MRTWMLAWSPFFGRHEWRPYSNVARCFVGCAFMRTWMLASPPFFGRHEWRPLYPDHSPPGMMIPD
ncbi:hypothetical protein, partial [Pantoea dispersa]|uniref:hypothetical protein n=1 Tax=Pantoea dispersa TaxID=59814 RepID=UPI001F52A82E